MLLIAPLLTPAMQNSRIMQVCDSSGLGGRGGATEAVNAKAARQNLMTEANLRLPW